MLEKKKKRKEKEMLFIILYVNFLKFIDHKYRLQLYLSCESTAECFLTLPFLSKADSIVLPR